MAPTLSNETLVEALNIFSQKERSINIIPHTSNRSFTVYTDKPETTPHYITLNYKDKSITILIAIPGRKQACQHCASTQHWTNHCKQPHLSLPQPTTPAPQSAEVITIQPVNPTPPSPPLDTSKSTIMKTPTTDQDAIAPQQQQPQRGKRTARTRKKH